MRDGRVTGTLHVSTGATGNTPVGHWSRLEGAYTHTWLGPAILFRTMTFHGGFARSHGFSPVPTYPASHRCVREPMWAAWTYEQTPVGTAVKRVLIGW